MRKIIAVATLVAGLLITGCEGKVCPEGETLTVTGYITTVSKYGTTSTPIYNCLKS